MFSRASNDPNTESDDARFKASEMPNIETGNTIPDSMHTDVRKRMVDGIVGLFEGRTDPEVARQNDNVSYLPQFEKCLQAVRDKQVLINQKREERERCETNYAEAKRGLDRERKETNERLDEEIEHLLLELGTNESNMVRHLLTIADKEYLLTIIERWADDVGLPPALPDAQTDSD